MNLQTTLGAGYFGFMVASMLYGLTCVQSFTYFRRNDRDRAPLKILIGMLWALDTIHLGFVAHLLYYYLIINFANPLAILFPVWSIFAQVLTSIIAEFIVRWVFIFRIHKLSNQKWLSGFLAVMNCFVLAIGIEFCYKGFQYRSFGQISNSWNVYLVFSISVITDLAITICMCTLLWRTRTGNVVSDRLVHALMRYVINGGILGSLITSLVLITYAALPNSFVFIAIYFSLCKACINSLLASLNARQRILRRGMDVNLSGRGQYDEVNDGYPVGKRPRYAPTFTLPRIASPGPAVMVKSDASSDPVMVQMTTVTTEIVDDTDAHEPKKPAPTWASGWRTSQGSNSP